MGGVAAMATASATLSTIHALLDHQLDEEKKTTLPTISFQIKVFIHLIGLYGKARTTAISYQKQKVGQEKFNQ